VQLLKKLLLVNLIVRKNEKYIYLYIMEVEQVIDRENMKEERINPQKTQKLINALETINKLFGKAIDR